MKIILTRLFGESAGEKSLYLGPWCVDYSAGQPADVRRILANPWADREKVDQAAEECFAYYLRLIKELTPIFNRIHGVNKEDRYWKILVGPWLLRFLHTAYDRYIHIAAAREAYGEFESACLQPEDYLTPQNTLDFNYRVFDDFYNHQLFTRIVRHMDLPHSLRSAVAGTTNSGNETEYIKRKERLRGLKKLLKWASFRMAANRRTYLCDVYLSRRDIRDMIVQSKGALWPSQYTWENSYPRIYHKDELKRSELSRIPWRNDFEELFVSLLADEIPALYLEGYASACQRIHGEIRRMPDRIFSSIGWFFNEHLKFLAAESLQNGVHLIGSQHGGGYGSGRIPVERQELDLVDTYCTWGWHAHGYDTRVLPSPRLQEQFRREHLAEAGRPDILFVGTNHPRYTYYLYSVPLNSQFDDYIGQRADFYRALEGTAQAAVRWRLYMRHYGRFDRQRLAADIPEARFDEAPSMEAALKTARLAVVDHLMTSYHELLAMNFPTIVIGNDRLWEVREGVRELYETLQEAGILFSDPRKAAEHINKVYHDPAAWWFGPEAQAARGAFCRQMACGSPHWCSLWQQMIAQPRRAAKSEGELSRVC